MADERQRVLITGASSGIGLETAAAFAGRGAAVALLARSDAGLEVTAERVRAAGGTPYTFPADVTDRPGLEAAVAAAVDALGGLDVAVVNAGAASYGRFRETAPADVDRTLDVTLRGAIDTTRAVLPALERSGGNLIIVGSMAAHVPLPLLGVYTAAKAGLRGFADALRIELRTDGSPISVQFVSPGPVDTPFWDNVATQEGRTPPPVPGSYLPEEVAAAIVACADAPAARGMTVGGLMLAYRGFHAVADRLSDRLLGVVAELARRNGAEGTGRRAIDEPAGAGRSRRGMRGSRPSGLVRLVAATARRLP